MKKLLLLSPFALLSCLAFTSKQISRPSITGLWADSNSVNFQHCTVIFSQEGEQVHMLHYLEFKGTPMVEEGLGTIKGNQVEYKVRVTKAIPGWVTEGTHMLTLSADGQTLRGVYRDHQDNTGLLVFKRLRQ